tara:strand:- start:831 stop:1124 length:294 start_codon:yes stop_codon:yes gene_type:complete
MSKYPTKKEHRVPLADRILFKIKNFIAGRIHRIGFNTSLWFRVQTRRRKAAAIDPVWKESWWCLERRYSMLAKKHAKLELKYLKQKDTIRKLRHGDN